VEQKHSHSPDRLKDVFGILIILMVFLQFFYPLLFEGKAIFFRDFNLITYPVRAFLSEVYHQGALPFWNPHIYAGAPFMAAFHTGVFYPPSLFLLMDDVTTGVNWFYLFHFWILIVPTYFLVRGWGLSMPASLCSALTAMLGGFFLSCVLLSNIFMAVVWLPLIFILFQEFVLSQKRRYFILAVLALASQTLGACPEVSILTVLLLFAFSLKLIPRTNSSLPPVKRVLALGAVVVLALGISSAQLVPTYKMVKLSNREGGLPFKTHAHWSMEWDKLSGIVLPQDFNDALADNQKKTFEGFLASTYMGIFSLASVLLAPFFFREKPIRFWFAVFWVGIFFSLGKNNLLYEAIYPGIPMLNLFRYPEKYFYLSAFAVVFLVPYFLDSLVRATRERTINIKGVQILWLVMFAMVGLLAITQDYVNPNQSLLVLAGFGFAYLFFYYKKLNEKIFVGLFCVMLLLDLNFRNYGLIPLIDKNLYEQEPVLMDLLNEDPDNFRVYSGRLEKTPDRFKLPNSINAVSGTIATKEHLIPFMGMIYGFDHWDGWPGLALELADHTLWENLLIKSPPDKRRRILKRANVKYWVNGDELTYYLEDGYPLILPNRLKPFNDALPRAFMVPRMRLGKDPQLLNTYYAEDFDPLQEVLLGEAVDFQESGQFEGTVRSLQYSPNRVSLKTRQKGNGFLVLLDSWFPGWEVTVDGKPAPILRANHFFRAVQLGPGDHSLEFEFRPVGFDLGLGISAVSAVFLVLFVLWRPRRKATPEYL